MLDDAALFYVLCAMATYLGAQILARMVDRVPLWYRFIRCRLAKSAASSRTPTQVAIAPTHELSCLSDKTEFLATINHELRTPLNGMLGMASVLQGTALSAEQRSYVDAIMQAGRALAMLIDDQLDAARQQAGHIAIVNTHFNIVALVESIIELLAPRAQAKGLDLAAYIDPHLSRMVYGDQARVRQILLNIIGNGIKYTQKGGVGVRLTAHDAPFLRFEVQDTGCGISPAAQARIFEPFQTDDAHYEHGTGLGLAIVARIVNAMGGNVWLEKSDATGSHFICLLPLAQTPTTAPHTLPRLAARHVLIIGNTPVEIPFLGERLKALGARVTHVHSLAQGHDFLTHNAAPDMVIVDCALGEEAQELAAHARRKGVPQSLILFSPFERHALNPMAENAFDGWLVKPVRSDTLHARLSNHHNAHLSCEPATLTTHVLRRVLIAEDDPINARLAVHHFERMGAAVTLARTGREAVDYATQNHDYDLIVMDIRMPDMDGLSAARLIRADEQRQSHVPTRIVALSANSLAEDRQAALDAGIDAFLTKPLDPDEARGLLADSSPPPEPAHLPFAQAL